MKRIVLLATGLGRGGAETQLVRLATGLKARGWSPVMGSVIDRNAFGPELEAAGIPVFSLGVGKGQLDPRGLLRLVEKLRELRPDVLCSFLDAANALGSAAARLTGVPVVVCSVRQEVETRLKDELLTRWYSALSDAVVFNAQTIAESCVSRGLVRRTLARVVRNGLDLSALDRDQFDRDEVRTELGLAPTTDGAAPFVWLTVGNLRPVKNYPALVRGFRGVLARFPNARLVCAGTFFSDHPKVLEEAGDLVEAGFIKLLGSRRDVPRLLSAADAFVLPSLSEASPNGLLEAMGAGLPCVATRLATVCEFLDEPADGLLANDPGHAALSGRMIDLMGLEPAARVAMGASAKHRVESMYGSVRMVDEFERLFAELGDRGQSSGVGC